MRAITLLTSLLVAFSLHAKMVPGMIVMNNNEERRGLIEPYLQIDDKKVKFRATEDSEVEKIPMEEIKKVVYFFEGGQTKEYYRKRPYIYKPLKKELVLDDEDAFFVLESLDNGLGMYYGEAKHPDNKKITGGYIHYISNETDDHIYFLAMTYSQHIGKYKVPTFLVNTFDRVFNETCPAFVEKMKTYEKKKIDIEDTIRMEYENECK